MGSRPDATHRGERRGATRRRSDRWERRLRPIAYAVAIDAVLISAVFVTQRRTRAGLQVISKRLKGEPAEFPRPRFVGNGNIEDFESFARELEQLRRNATTDAVTGLANKATLRMDLLLYSELAARERTSLSVLVADVDHFKEVNDRHGHAAGDAVLAELGRRLASVVGSNGIAGRWGGDEFLLLIPRADHQTAMALGEAGRLAVESVPFALPTGEELTVTMTLGVATSSADDVAGEALFDRADAALLEAKRAGRNRVGSSVAVRG